LKEVQEEDQELKDVCEPHKDEHEKSRAQKRKRVKRDNKGFMKFQVEPKKQKLVEQPEEIK
jgi:hypothetical protein